jgi:hypothetical protein
MTEELIANNGVGFMGCGDFEIDALMKPTGTVTNSEIRMNRKGYTFKNETTHLPFIRFPLKADVIMGRFILIFRSLSNYIQVILNPVKHTTYG